ncbi:M56 family metallopeptidase [Emticicia sp. 17c]|uniref:M56 family metallopeptidase n=1 Tax=Emticicia sp. 17c TaxID=3127704 RepID=UPI00301C63AD
MLFLYYLLKASACLAIFYGLYFFAFRQFTFHTLNRFYLLFTLCLSFVIPLVSFETTRVVQAAEAPLSIAPTGFVIPETPAQAYTESSSYLPLASNEVIKPKEAKTDWRIYLIWVYTSIATFLLLRFLLKIAKLIHLSKKAEKVNGLWIVRVEGNWTNASFLKYIFLNTNGLTATEEAQIIAHECVHIRHFHSIDVLLTEICKVVLWFNPVVYLYKKSLTEIHEFEADANMVRYFDSKDYAHLLLKLGINTTTDLSNQFSLHPLSKRIQFIFKKRTVTMKKLFYFLMLPLVGIGLFAFAQRKEKLILDLKRNLTKTLATIPQKIDSAMVTPIASAEAISSKQDSSQKPVALMSNPLLLYTPEIALPTDFKMKGGAGPYSITISNPQTPATYLFPLAERFMLKEADITIFQKEKELQKGIDFNFIYEGDKLTGVSFKEHISSPSTGFTAHFKELQKINILTTKEAGIMMPPMARISTTPKNSLWRYNNFGINPQRTTFNTDSLRTYLPSNFLGKEPLVIINGREYHPEILHRINPRAFGWSYLAKPNEQQAIDKYGEKARDGVLEIRTTDDFLFKSEKEHQLALDNIRRELNAYQIYKNDKIIRVRLLDENNEEFERIVIGGFRNNQRVSFDVPIGGKISYKIDGKSVTEADIMGFDGFFEGSSSWKSTDQKNGFYGEIDLRTKK